MKALIDKFNSLAGKSGHDISIIFDDFLRYMICYHSIPPEDKIDDWSYSKEDNKGFFEIYQQLILTMQEKLKHSEWFDPFGEIYEALIAGKGRRDNKGQFFTPGSLCQLMTDIQSKDGDNIVGKRIYDPTCGSGRTLLSFHAKHLGNYIVGEDLDKTCAMMTVCNFLLHGVVGEVVWHDTLNPDKFFGAWKVNEHLNDATSWLRGLPHVRTMKNEETMSFKSMEQLKKEVV